MPSKSRRRSTLLKSLLSRNTSSTVKGKGTNAQISLGVLSSLQIVFTYYAFDLLVETTPAMPAEKLLSQNSVQFFSYFAEKLFDLPGRCRSLG